MEIESDTTRENIGDEEWPNFSYVYMKPFRKGNLFYFTTETQISTCVSLEECTKAVLLDNINSICSFIGYMEITFFLYTYNYTILKAALKILY